MGFLQRIHGESLRRGKELCLELGQRLGAPVLWAIQQDLDGVNRGAILTNVPNACR